MAVEILIRSGARRNDEITLDGRDFRVGSDPDCEVFFDPQRDGTVRGRSAQFRLQEDGWYFRGTGGEMSINGRRVVGAMHVRSGDVIRMSESGPEFAFRIVARAKASPTKSLAVTGASPSPNSSAVESHHDGVTAGQAAEAGMAPAVATDSWRLVESGPVGVPHAGEPGHDLPTPARAAQTSVDGRWAIWIMGVLGLGVLAFVTLVIGVVALIAMRQSPPVTPPAPPVIVRVGAASVPQPPTGTPQSPPIGKQAGQTPPEATQEPVNPTAQVEQAVFLVQAEKAGHLWPFTTCVAIGRDTLLTTAREAAQLAKWREERGFKVWVTRQADGFKEEAQDIRVIALFRPLADKPGDWMYADLGLLTVGVRLPKTAAVASPEELANVKERVPVTCIGFACGDEAIADSDNVRPQRSAGRVFLITGSRDLPGRPRVLHIRAQIPKYAYGSPVVNADGNIIGLYGDAVPESKGLKNLHYVTLVNPEAIRLWLQDRGSKSDEIWLSALPAPTPNKTQNKP